MSSQLTTIFFDVGNTLLFPDRPHILAPLHQRNIHPTIEQLHAAERITKRKFDAILEGGGTLDHGFWSMYYMHLLEDVGVQDEALHHQLADSMRYSANWSRMLPGTREILDRLAKQFRLGVISNADGKVATVLERCGIAECFGTITDSGVVGHEKPHPAIFQAALQSMNAQPHESLYVGDVYSVDYLGATRAGMQAILFDVAGTYRDRSLLRVESLEELERRLKLASVPSHATCQEMRYYSSEIT